MIGCRLSRSVHAAPSSWHVRGFPEQSSTRVFGVPIDGDRVFRKWVLLLDLAQLGGELFERPCHARMLVQHAHWEGDGRHLGLIRNGLPRQAVEPPLDTACELEIP